MFDELTVAENIFMGHMPRRAALSTGREMRAARQALLVALEAELHAATLG